MTIRRPMETTLPYPFATLAAGCATRRAPRTRQMPTPWAPVQRLLPVYHSVNGQGKPSAGKGTALILCLFPFRLSGNDHGDTNQGWAFEKCEAILSKEVGQRGVHTCPCLSVASPISLETGDSLGSFLLKKGTIHTTCQRAGHIRTGDRVTSVINLCVDCPATPHLHYHYTPLPDATHTPVMPYANSESRHS